MSNDYTVGSRLELKPNPSPRFQDWSTVVIVGKAYLFRQEEFYPVHVNGRTYEVVARTILDINFKRYVDFTPGFYEFVSLLTMVVDKTKPVVYFYDKPPKEDSQGYWRRRTVVDWRGAKHA